MKKIPKKGWFVWRMVLLTLLFNIIIISVSNNNQNVIWLLIVSIPLLLIVIYHARQTSLFLPYYTNISKASTQQPGFELLSHSIYPNRIAQDDFEVVIGNDQCGKPHKAFLLTLGSQKSINYQWSIHQASDKRLENSMRVLREYVHPPEDTIWQIDSSYQGCKTQNGNFDSAAFKRIACRPDVKMVEIELGTSKNSKYTKDSNLERSHSSIFHESGFTTFCDPEGLVHFLETLRNHSGGKPVGIRISKITKKEFHQICHAIRKTEIIPDFIVVEGAGERGVYNHLGFHFDSEIPLYDAVLFVSQTLQVYGLEKEIKLIAAGKINSGFEIMKLLALGANLISAEIAEFDRKKYGNLNEARFQYWTNNLQNRLMNDFAWIMNVCGFRNLNDISLSKFFSRLDVLKSKQHVTRTGEILESGIGKIKYIGKATKLESSEIRS